MKAICVVMYKHECFRGSIIISSHQVATVLLNIIYASILVQAGASSTPKNLVSPIASSEITNLTTVSSNQFQNEYQYRQTASKPSTSSERHKSSTASTLTDTSFDTHSPNDFTSPGASDYPYLDSRAMANVPDCKGRLRLNGTRGFITDGPGHYAVNLQCSWLIDSGRDNATIRIQLHQFMTECNYDFVYVFDGDSVYSPLVAALTGDINDFGGALAEARPENPISNVDISQQSNSANMMPSNTTTSSNSYVLTKNSAISQSTPESQPFELRTYSGKAFIYFHSDTAQTMQGFYMTYSVDSCPLDCSNRGDCDYKTSTCKCNIGFYGDGCQFVLCPNNCTSPAHGTCDKDRSCVCNKDYTGQDCSKKADQQVWRMLVDSENSSPPHPRAFHQSVVVDNIMWIFGGKTQALSNTNMGIYRHKKTTTILAFDLENKKWIDQTFEGVTGKDHLAELSGHSVAAHGKKVFIFGGMPMNGSILNTLSVFDTETRQLTSISSEKVTRGADEEFFAPLSVTGHSANIIDGQMYVFMGYNPLYGYLNFVQKFNIANNSWSIVERRGSSGKGCIGHTSTFDLNGRLVYIYGGHNEIRFNKLYSFDPQTEIWTYLFPGPSSRYHHSALIMNGLLMILGGSGYNSSYDECYPPTHNLVYNLSCAQLNTTGNDTHITTTGCGQKCWSIVDGMTSSVMKRHGHTAVARNDKEIILYGGFNGVILNDLKQLDIPSCANFNSESECLKSKFGLNCEWDSLNSTCELQTSPRPIVADHDCSKAESKQFQYACETRETCTDCLNTNFGCVWCGQYPRCQYNKCRSLNAKAILSSNNCHLDEPFTDTAISTKFAIETRPEQPNDIDCKTDNCYLCQSKAMCAWQNEVCSFNPPNSIPSLLSNPLTPQEELIDGGPPSRILKNSTRAMQNTQKEMIRLPDPFHRSFLAAFSLLNASPYQTCDIPCFMRRSCNECTTTKCIWCSTTEQCIDSSAYFSYHTMGQCMHYVAHMSKCPVASCMDIETCDKCLANPKCGWLNDISNTGKGRCMDGTSGGPSIGLPALAGTDMNATSYSQNQSNLPSWYYSSCPSCQCNGHSYCKSNSSLCVQPCQDFTEGPHCDRCIPGYYGDPINGGLCKQCRCNGHAQSCNRETGKCYCSTKGIAGHNCNRCDDKNYYIGDPSSPGNGTCYYNLTTDYQYTFNMSKPEDHFYSNINFINVPLRKDSDIDFSIACSRLALVNITCGTSYKNRRQIHTALECGSFRLRFSHDRYNLYDSNYSFFVHVYRFQTPITLQIAFSQHRTLYLPQFFFTFSSAFLFFFALSGVAWKIKHEYDLYVRRQRQFIEMEQMASRPFSTILLEIFRPSSAQKSVEIQPKQQTEPTPISFEPCFGSNVGVLSVFVQLPGKPNLAIGSALVTLNDDVACSSHKDDNETSKRSSSKEN